MKLAANQVCTLWKKTGVDGEGKDVFAPPVEFLARWEERSAKFQEHNGDERMSNSVIYLDNFDLLSPGDFVAEGSRVDLFNQTNFISDDELAQLIASLADGNLAEFLALCTIADIQPNSFYGVSNLSEEITAFIESEHAGFDYLSTIDRKSISIRSVRAKNRVPSINAKNQLVKIYCQ